MNYLVYGNNKRWDLTEDKQNTLTQETLDTLAKLPDPVQVQGFFTANTPSDTAQRLLARYAEASDGKFTYEFINPDTNPVAAEKANITRDGTLVVKMGERQEPVSYVTEQDLTNSLVRLMSGGTKKVYFLTGHGERDPNGSGDNSYSKLRARLTDKNYTVETLSLLTQATVPADANLVIVAGPTQPLLEGEVQALSKYLDAGGKLIVMWEPTLLVNFGETPDFMADYLAQHWGIQLGNDLVVDMVGQQLVQQPFMAVGAEYGNHAITSKMQGMATFFFTARSVSTAQAMDGVSQTELVKTSTNSWAETNLEGLKNQQQPTFEPTDTQGPISLMMVAENSTSQARLVVVGDSDFAADGSFSAYGNGDLIVNSIDWAVGQEDLISLTPKSSTTRTLSLTPTTYTMGLLFLISVIVLPVGSLVLGVVAFVYRRRRG